MFFAPTEIAATAGFTASRNKSEVEYLDPWCATFKTSEETISPELTICFSAFASMSPVNKKDLLLKVNFVTRLDKFVSFGLFLLH